MNTRTLLRDSWRSWFDQDFRTVGPWWLQLVWTFVFSMVVALGFTLLALALNAGRIKSFEGLLPSVLRLYGQNLVVSLCVGYVIHGLVALVSWLIGIERLRRQSGRFKSVYYTVLSLLGVAIGWPIGVSLVFGQLQKALPLDRPNVAIGTVAVVLLVCFAFWIFFNTKHDQLQAERTAAEAQLKLLQGQIEPHFLFNTLANVLSLMDHDTPRARVMLESFIDYLRASLGSLRHERHTLGDELALVEAYLQVVGIRMDDRLRWRIEVPDDLKAATLPALLLQPLVENAIVHGLEPKLDGGEVSVTVTRRGDQLVLTVLDDGLGLPEAGAPKRHPNGTGTACRNIRERLLQRFGDGGKLQIATAASGGVQATLTLPYSTTP
jgi:signal transduction histidine kinase